MAETPLHCRSSSRRNETRFSNLPLGQDSHCSTPTMRMQPSLLHGYEIWHTQFRYTSEYRPLVLCLSAFMMRWKYLVKFTFIDTNCHMLS